MLRRSGFLMAREDDQTRFSGVFNSRIECHGTGSTTITAKQEVNLTFVGVEHTMLTWRSLKALVSNTNFEIDLEAVLLFLKNALLWSCKV